MHVDDVSDRKLGGHLKGLMNPGRRELRMRRIRTTNNNYVLVAVARPVNDTLR
jgi:hypothetical protein